MYTLYFQKLVTNVDSWLFYFSPSLLLVTCFPHQMKHFPRDYLIHKKRRCDLKIMSFPVVSCQSFCFYIQWPKPWSWSEDWSLANWSDLILCFCIRISNSESQDISVGAGLFWTVLVNHLSDVSVTTGQWQWQQQIQKGVLCFCFLSVDLIALFSQRQKQSFCLHYEWCLCNTRLCCLLLSSTPRSVTGLCKTELSAEERCSCCSQGSALSCLLLTLMDKCVRNQASWLHLLASRRWCLFQGQLWRFDVFLAAYCISQPLLCKKAEMPSWVKARDPAELLDCSSGGSSARLAHCSWIAPVFSAVAFGTGWGMSLLLSCA